MKSIGKMQTLQKTKFGKVCVQTNICGHLKNIRV